MRPHYRYGSQAWSLFRCAACGHSFSERRNTPLFRLQLKEQKVFEIIDDLARGVSLRKTAESAGVDKNSVLRVRRLGENHPRWFQLAMAERGGLTEERAEQIFRYLRKRRQVALRNESDQASSRTRTR